jgi:hypothetical protein
MLPSRLTALVVLAAAVGGAGARADEFNAWPVKVVRTDPSAPIPDRSGLGPFLFSHATAEGGRVGGFRPFYVRKEDAQGETVETTVLYPLFFYRRYGATDTWSVFDLINHTGRVRTASPQAVAETGPAEHNFDIWPIYFSHQTGDPQTSYRAVLPLYGDVRSFFGYGRIAWTAFPLYVRTEKAGSTTTYVPWPIVRREHGREEGFAVWPLFGRYENDRGDRRRYWLWPLAWHNTRTPDPEAPPTRATLEQGFIPFYTHEEGPSGVDQSYFWPFFGYTDRTLPHPYHETRYFWPFLVQGRGEVHSTHRWGPVYTHSFKQGVESTWILWPLWHRRTWADAGLQHTDTRFFFFFGSTQEQRSLARPAAAPAVKLHVFPLLSAWTNGAGRRQVEVLSPFEPLFSDNPEVRDAWSPLFALYRSDQRAPGDVRTSLLWNAVTWERKPGRGLAEFHLGPLFGMRRRTEGPGWHLFWFDFSPNRSNLAAQAR